MTRPEETIASVLNLLQANGIQVRNYTASGTLGSTVVEMEVSMLIDAKTNATKDEGDRT